MNRNDRHLLKIFAIMSILMFMMAKSVFSLPEVEEVVSGSADIQCPEANSMTINATDNTIINFTSFDILENESVFVTLPSVDSRILNRVTGNDASDLFGALSCNGLFILVNESGIHVGPNAQIDAGRLILSTRDITDSNFLSGNYLFQKMSQQQLDMLLLNEGTINITEGGYGVLIAGAVENKGIITAPASKIALAGGDAIRLDIAGGGLISVAIEMETASTIMDYQGNPITDQIKNTGTLEANGGTVILKAESVADVFEKVINLEGFVTANTVEQNGGTIRIVAEGDVRTNAEIRATNIEIGDPSQVTPDNLMMDGGFLQAEDTISIQVANDIVVNIVTAEEVNLTAGNSIDKRDDPAAIITGTRVNLKTNRFGGDSRPLNIDASELIINRASGVIDIAESTGIGTSVLLRGPPAGFGEIQYNKGASLTLDAEKVIISGTDPSYLYGDITFSSLECTVPDKIIYFEAGKTFTIRGTLKTQGAYARHVKLLSSEQGTQWNIYPQSTRDLTYTWVEDSLNLSTEKIMMTESTNRGNCTGWDPTGTWTGAVNSLWSNAGNWDDLGGATPGAGDSVLFDGTSAVDSTIDPGFAGTIDSMTINGYTGTITQNTGLTITGDYAQSSGTFTCTDPANNSFSAGGSFSLPGGTFNRYTGTGIDALNAYMIRDVYDLQAIKCSLASHYALNNNVSASGTTVWNEDQANPGTYFGFEPVGNAAAKFTGTLNGANFTISDLYIDRPATDYVGLFGYTYNQVRDIATLQNVGLAGGSVTGNDYTGSLVGCHQCIRSVLSDSITNSQAIGVAVNGGMYVGGLVGQIRKSNSDTVIS
ncbi:MAG: filamentous hemagglutinin N-terminal domain-containing protein, partial [Deltaproteobacteria bacterium]|nr:filamentous hemagglutinin N-terminal domain-containing protein [Deltaproteobacteria bacterium]